MYGEKLPPHDVAAEEGVIGSLLIDSEAIFKVAHFLAPEDFYREKNRWAYEACLSLFERSEPMNQITVAHELSQKERLEAIGGAAYLSELVLTVPTSVHVEYYAQIVNRLGIYRRLISASGQIAAIGYDADPDLDSSLARSEELLFRLRHGQSIRDFVHIRDVLEKYLEERGFAPVTAEGEVPFAETGFIDLDRMLGGLQRSDLVILAARPSLGKTSLALNVALHAASTQHARTAIFSLEMSKEQLVQRLLASESGVDSKRIRLGHEAQSHAEERLVMDAVGKLAELPIYIDDSPIIRVPEIRSKARRLENERGVDLIIVDYLQLITGTSNSQNRVQEISEISRSLKLLARELGVPVLTCSQLSRAVEMRSPKIPQLADLRESGSIEQDADVVLFIYREDAYTSQEEWEKTNATEPYPKGIADIIVAKHRNGPTGKIQLRFFDKTAKFANFSSRS